MLQLPLATTQHLLLVQELHEGVEIADFEAARKLLSERPEELSIFDSIGDVPFLNKKLCARILAHPVGEEHVLVFEASLMHNEANSVEDAVAAEFYPVTLVRTVSVVYKTSTEWVTSQLLQLCVAGSIY